MNKGKIVDNVFDVCETIVKRSLEMKEVVLEEIKEEEKEEVSKNS